MMRTVQLVIADAVYAAALRDALSHSGPWHVEFVDRPNLERPGVLVLDEPAFERLALPLARPERVVLIIRQDPDLLAQAWDAGIVSVVSRVDTLPTVLLAIMAAALRAAQAHETVTSDISPSASIIPAQITPQSPISRPRRCRTP
ncbi:MAG: hypothetical protein LAP40_05895 [Acidobacteriia bacterium]|nr:hypothetical protein [Terriglobia bacterium]